MKTVTGKILSSSPISVSKAAKIITNFAATDNGASQAISAYLRRASASFIELKQLHRELQKPSRSGRKHKKSKSETTVEDGRESSLEPSVFISAAREDVELSQEASQGCGDGERKKHKGKKKKDRESNWKEEKSKGNIAEEESKTVTEQSKVKKHKEKSGRNDGNLQENGMSFEKVETRDGEEREGEKKKTNKKKRKSGEIEDRGIENNASSEPRKKKKKIKNGV